MFSVVIIEACGCMSVDVGVVVREADDSQGLLLPTFRSGVWASFQVWSVGWRDDTFCGGRIPGYSRKSLFPSYARVCAESLEYVHLHVISSTVQSVFILKVLLLWYGRLHISKTSESEQCRAVKCTL